MLIVLFFKNDCTVNELKPFKLSHCYFLFFVLQQYCAINKCALHFLSDVYSLFTHFKNVMYDQGT